MIAGPALPCPKCRKVLEPMSWHGMDSGCCWNCRTDFSFRSYPALNAKRVPAVPKAVLEAEHATCFYHSTNQAEVVCEACGRFICSVCAVDFGGRSVCPPCIATQTSNDTQAVTQRTLYDGIALAVALVPLLFFPATLLTAPVALGFVIVGWRKPASLVRGNRVRLILAGVLALLQIAGWTAVFVSRLVK